MKEIEIKTDDMLAAEASIPLNTPFYMLNLLRYRAEAQYKDGQEGSCTGREAYFKRYIPEFVKLASAYPEIKPFWFGKTVAGLVLAENERWDNVALIYYPNFESFKNITESTDYIQNALPHRLAALEDFRLIVTVEENPL